MKMTIRRDLFASSALFLSLTWGLCLWSIDSLRAQDKTGGAAGAAASLDLRGDVPNPPQINAAELHQLPRTETRTTDPGDPGKEIVYAGTPLIEVLKAGGLRLDADKAGLRETLTTTVLVDASDGYRAVFALAELDSELTDRVILLADTKDGQALSAREGPFRIIVPGEKRPARWVRQVTALTVRKN
jgi:DMSO/TMAO reductase YedYZ molybdopterin-dependent catalytic subunit